MYGAASVIVERVSDGLNERMNEERRRCCCRCCCYCWLVSVEDERQTERCLPNVSSVCRTSYINEPITTLLAPPQLSSTQRRSDRRRAETSDAVSTYSLLSPSCSRCGSPPGSLACVSSRFVRFLLAGHEPVLRFGRVTELLPLVVSAPPSLPVICTLLKTVSSHQQALSSPTAATTAALATTAVAHGSPAHRRASAASSIPARCHRRHRHHSLHTYRLSRRDPTRRQRCRGSEGAAAQRRTNAARQRRRRRDKAHTRSDSATHSSSSNGSDWWTSSDGCSWYGQWCYDTT